MMTALVRERFGDAALLTWKMEEGPTSQGMCAACRNWKGKGMDSSLSASSRNATLHKPRF